MRDPVLCGFSDAGNDDLTTRSGGRRPKAPRHEIASAGSAGRCRGLYMATGREVKAGRLHKREVPMRTAKVG